MKKSGKVLLVILAFSIAVTFSTLFIENTALSAAAIILVPTLSYIGMMLYEISTGKIFAPGAKQRRKKLLPSLFGRKSIF